MQMMKQEINQKCIDSCFDCVEACDMCMMECMGTPGMKSMSRCVQLCMDCAEMCMVTGRLMSRNSEFAKFACSLCEQMCSACAAECSKHMDMTMCKNCADACKNCADECRKMSTA